MTALTTLLCHPFEKTFTEIADNEKITKIKDVLFEKYHTTLTSSIIDFKKFEFVAGQILGDNSKIIKQTYDKICHKESKNFIEIKDEQLKNIILKSYNNSPKKHILDVAFDYPLTIWEIASRVKIGTISLSENISYLILNGLLATNDLSDEEHNKKYYSTVDDVSVKMNENQFHLYVTINDIANESLK